MNIKNGHKTMSSIKIALLLLLSYVSVISALTTSPQSPVSIVTGANGYLGREIVHELLRTASNSIEDKLPENETPQKQPIICLVRETRVEDETKYWEKYCPVDHPCNIFVYPYDMLDGGESFEKALQDFVVSDARNDQEEREGKYDNRQSIVYHVASVFGPTDDHKQTALDNVKGAEDVVHCLSRVSNTRLILTSSMAAVRGTGQTPKNGKYYTSEDWNTVSQLGTNWGSSYQWSKMESERRALELAKQFDIPMVSLCPSFIFGPSTDGRMESNSYSITLIEKWMNGETEVQSRLCVDIRDVAKAHVAAAKVSMVKKNDNEGLHRRYILSSECRLTSKRIGEILMEFSTTPERIHYDMNFDGGAIKIGDKEVEALEQLESELGVKLTPVNISFRDMGKDIMKKQATISK